MPIRQTLEAEVTQLTRYLHAQGVTIQTLRTNLASLQRSYDAIADRLTLLEKNWE